MNKIKVLIADDQELIRDGIGIILKSQPDIEVVGCACDGEEAVEMSLNLSPDIVLMDIHMPKLSGIDAVKRIKEKNPKIIVIILTTFDPDEYIYGAFKNGVDGYLLKDMSGEKLISMVHDAYEGNMLLPVSIAARIIAGIPHDSRKKSLEEYGLSVREIEVAVYMARGFKNEQIAEAMQLGTGTVKNYISMIYSKLEVKYREEAIRLINSLTKHSVEGGRL